MSTDYSNPPLRDLPSGRLAQRKEHLLSEIAREREPHALFPSIPRFRLPRIASRRALPALAAALAAAVFALLLVSPWRGTPSLSERALAAIGHAPVLHVVTVQPDWFPASIDIETGRAEQQTIETEIWFDGDRELKKTASRLDGVLIEDVLETPEGGFTQGGPLITCAWIAAHPVEATKLRVSCNADMENGTTPRQIPETPPTLDLRLAGFVDNYRTALESGSAEELGRDTIDGRSVIWLRFGLPTSPRPQGEPPGPAQTSDVAVDASTYQPVRLRSADGQWSTDITVAETLPYRASLFSRPAKSPPGPSYGAGRGEAPIELAQAAQVLGRSPLWLGQEWQGLRLVSVTKLDLSTGYGALSGLEPTMGTAVRFTYAAEAQGGDDGPTLEISESTKCEFALRWLCGPRDPPEGKLSNGMFPGTALARRDGLYLSIRTDAPGFDPLAIVRALEPSS